MNSPLTASRANPLTSLPSGHVLTMPLKLGKIRLEWAASEATNSLVLYIYKQPKAFSNLIHHDHLGVPQLNANLGFDWADPHCRKYEYGRDVPHVLNHCKIHSLSEKRHDAMQNRIKKLSLTLPLPLRTITSCRLLLAKQKIQKYQPIPGSLRAAGKPAYLDTIVVASLGSRDPVNDTVLLRLGIFMKYAILMWTRDKTCHWLPPLLLEFMARISLRRPLPQGSLAKIKVLWWTTPLPPTTLLLYTNKGICCWPFYFSLTSVSGSVFQPSSGHYSNSSPQG
ncbi:hypothetical protein TNCV_3593741 [Trichonephila clavipes]|nr:hypothetical protein TNCV_3593741 [Trichonephila clavipes]